MNHILESIKEDALMVRVEKQVDNLFRYELGKPQLQIHTQIGSSNDEGSTCSMMSEEIHSSTDLEEELRRRKGLFNHKVSEICLRNGSLNLIASK